jgi:hypothetical protein
MINHKQVLQEKATVFCGLCRLVAQRSGDHFSLCDQFCVTEDPFDHDFDHEDHLSEVESLSEECSCFLKEFMHF